VFIVPVEFRDEEAGPARRVSIGGSAGPARWNRQVAGGVSR
jgi:hypothetical protein